MKKSIIRLICLILLLLIVGNTLMLSSCQNGKETTTTTEGDDRRFRNADTLEKYNDFMDKYVFSNSFVTYDSLSDLGEFDKFYIHYCMGAKEKYTEEELALLEFSEEYHYKLKGKNGSELYIQVHFAPEFDEVIDRPPEYQHLEMTLKANPGWKRRSITFLHHLHSRWYSLDNKERPWKPQIRGFQGLLLRGIAADCQTCASADGTGVQA